jgi:predicted HTH transcriptional regulator
MTSIVDDINKLLLPRYLLNDIYPHPECTQLEFKKSFHINQHAKYRETICAFLNTNGGHIIYGILDNCIINGCTLDQLEKDSILLFVDGIYTILKNTDGENISKEKIKVCFEEIAKNVYIVIISCYRNETDINTYQFLSGDSWTRMNASNMKTNIGKLFTVHDVSTIKLRLYNRCEETIKKYKKEYNKCEESTIIEISNILIHKSKKENELLLPVKQKNINYLLVMMLFFSTVLNITFLLKRICV